MALITIKTFQSSVDAHILKAKFESEGIRCFINGENVSNLKPIYNAIDGGIKLKIDDKDLSKVKEIYKELEQTPYTDEKGKVISCPKCKSERISTGFKSFKGLKGFMLLMLSVILAIFPIGKSVDYKCDDCKNEFKMKK